MPVSASVTWFQRGSTPTTGTPITSDNPIAFGTIERGYASTPESNYYPVDLWNDRAAALGSPLMTLVTIGLSVVSGSGNTGQIRTGTAANDFQPMLEARSNGGYGCADDGQTDWTAIGDDDRLDVGDIGSNQMRQIYFRLNVPYDADAADATFRPDTQYDDGT